MRMPIKMIAVIARISPRAHGIVAERNHLLALVIKPWLTNFDFLKLAYPDKRVVFLHHLNSNTVVVSLYDVEVAVESFLDFHALLQFHLEVEVPENVDKVPLLNYSVVVGDVRLVHFLHAGEGPLLGGDKVPVSQVPVGGDP
jgi:hypothetical protein